jgi:hypothetical protein
MDLHSRVSPNQEKYFDWKPRSPTIGESFNCVRLLARRLVKVLSKPRLQVVHFGGILMSGQVILYFEDQADALRFALAAGSVMAGDGARFTDDLVQETARVSRIRLDAANAGKIKKVTSERVA